MSPADRVHGFCTLIYKLAVKDAEDDIPERHACNTGSTLLVRMPGNTYRTSPRHGDAKFARSLYTAYRFFLETEEDTEENSD